jgi:colicin import membrane protein
MRRTPLAFLLALPFLATPTAAQEFENELRDLSFVGFQQYKEVSRVFVRTTDAVKFRVENSRDDMVVLTLENTSATVANNLRHLDTSFFKSPVAMITPKLIEGPSPSVQIEIRLRQKVPYRQSQADNVVNVDFQIQ